MIRVFPCRVELDSAPIETHHTCQAMSVRSWVSANAPQADLDDLPVTIYLNGLPATLDTVFQPDDVLDIHVEPRGVSLVVAAVVAVVAAVAVTLLMPAPSMPKGQQQGSQLGSSSLSANTPRMGEPIPDVAGRPPRLYPDYLVPPRTHFTSKKTQWTEVFLCIGLGQYQKSINDVFIGDTRATTMGDHAEVRFYEPGESVASETAADYWHTPKEVGFAGGSQGLELGKQDNVATGSGVDSLTVDGFTIESGPGQGSLPSSWAVGIVLSITVPWPATVTPGVPRDTITTEFGLAHINPEVGMMIQMEGEDSAVYEVASYTPPGPGQPAEPGTPSTFTGSAAPARLDFGATPAILSASHSGIGYSIVLSQDFVTVAELVASIASQLNGTSLTASMDGGAVRISEVSPFSGSVISVTGTGRSDVFGSNPTAITGEETVAEIPPSWSAITLNDENGEPVRGLTPGVQSIAFGPPGMSYEITAVNSNRLRTVEAVGLPGWNGWPALTSAAIDARLGSTDGIAGWTGPFAVVPIGEVCNAFEVDYVFPGGLRYTKSSGSTRNTTAQIRLAWRRAGSSDAWNFINLNTRDGTRDSIGFTHRVDLPEYMRPEVMMSHNNVSSSSKTTNRCDWIGLRGRMPAPTFYDGVTTMSVRMRTGDKLSTQTENKVWLKVTRILETVAGGSWEPTRDLAPYFLHVLESVGYGRDRVDMATLTELHGIWSARQDRFDHAVTSTTTVKTLLNHVLKAGFAELTVDRGLIKPVRDVRRSRPNYIYSPQELTAYPAVTSVMPEDDEVDGVDGEFTNQLTGRTEVIKFRLPGDEGRRAQKINLIGITDYDHAFKMTARHRRVLAYRRTTFKGETEMQALNSTYMSYDRIQEGIPGYGQSAFVVSSMVDGAGVILRLSESMDWDRYPDPVLALRDRDGRIVGPFPATRSGYDDQVFIENPGIQIAYGQDGSDPTIVYFGEIQNWSHGVLIKSIKPSADGRVQIEAVEYDDRVYDDDGSDPDPIDWILSMGDLVLWLDADQNDRIISGAGGVSEWIDRSPEENNATQGSTSYRPGIEQTVFSPRSIFFQGD